MSRLEKGMDQAIENSVTNEDDNVQLINEAKRDKKIMNSDKTKSLKPEYKQNNSKLEK
jgi:hypothetical protein